MPRAVLFLLGFSVPMGAAVLSVWVSSTTSHPVSIPPWAWLLYFVLSVGFGALAAIGFTYDIAYEVEIQDEGMLAHFASRELFYAWRDISPTAVVFPDKIRFRNLSGRPFFLRSQMVRDLLADPDVPGWDLPPKVRKRVGTVVSS
jgi:hypothetical protein